MFKILGIFVVSLLIGLGGLYALINPATPPSRSPALSPNEISSLAQTQVKPPQWPEAPTGAIVRLSDENVLLHFPTSHLHSGEVPPTPIITHKVPQIASPAQAGAANWQAQVNARNAAYQQELQQKINELTAAASNQNTGDTMTATVIPLIAAVGGLITALASLISAIRSQSGRETA